MTLRRRLFIWWYLLRKIPLVVFLGIKVVEESAGACRVVIPRLWRNRNPFGITYFGALIAAGEMAGGMLLIQRVLDASEYGIKFGVMIRSAEASFKKQATGPITFVCEEGAVIEQVMNDILGTYGTTSNKPTQIKLRSTGYNQEGRVAAIVDITWLVKVINV